MNRRVRLFTTVGSLGLWCLLAACGGEEGGVAVTTEAPGQVDPYTLASVVGERINVVIEIPAGTNHKVEYRAEERDYRVDTLADGSDRVINFLAYPGNYGFIPSTLMDERRGGDGDALDVLVLGEALPTGSVIEALPIATLLLRDAGEIDTKIVAVPAEAADRVFAVDNFLDFSLGNDAAKRIIELWFLNYKGPGVMELIRWEDEAYARREIAKWQIEPKAVE